MNLAAGLSATHPVRVCVVTWLGLGTLNHTALTVSALRARSLEPAGLILGSMPLQPDLAAECNRTELPRLTGVSIIGAFPDGAGGLDPSRFRQHCRQGGWTAEVTENAAPSHIDESPLRGCQVCRQFPRRHIVVATRVGTIAIPTRPVLIPIHRAL